MSTTFHAGSIMAVTVDDNGYHVAQVNDTQSDVRVTNQSIGPNKTVPVDYYRFPVAVQGIYETTVKQLIVDVEVFGSKVGPKIYWNFNLGDLNIPLDLKIAKGLITIYLKGNNECWIRYKIAAKVGGQAWEFEELMFKY